jgi:uncharacterized protein YbaP (TraB family)
MRKTSVILVATVLVFTTAFPHVSNALYQWTDDRGQVHITDYPRPVSDPSYSLQKNTAKHSLWKVSSKTNTVFLLGSIHLLKQDDYPLDRAIESAYEKSSRLYFEVNLDTVDEQKLQRLAIAKGTQTNARTLKDDLSTQTYETARKHLSDIGLTIEQFSALKPWLLATTLVVGELQKLGYDPGQGIDKYFYDKAKKDHKSVDGFEMAEYQVGLFSDMTASVQEALLLQTLSEIHEIGLQFPAIITAWKSGETEALDSTLLKSFQEYPAIYKTLLSDRNRNWLPKILSLIGRGENCMVVVGTAHLVGADGIIAILKQKGYRVEQL